MADPPAAVRALKALTYAPTGAMIAAATTSLPEAPGGERNWDYRYSWLRDSTFMLWALYTLGFTHEATDFFYFIADRVEDGDLQIMYGIDGRGRLDEVTLDHLSYYGARPVRVGNDAWHQRQHDVWGVLLDSVRLHTHSSDRLDDRLWTLITRQVDAALEHWREPDRGIWEWRADPKHFTSSKLFCWVAADRGAASACAMTRQRPSAGKPPPRRCTTTSARTGPTPVASSCSTTKRTPWTPRCFCSRSFDSCRQPTNACGQPS